MTTNKLIEAICSKDLEASMCALIELDLFLTGHQMPDSHQKMTRSELRSFLENDYPERSIVVYLSDGGFSRLLIRWADDQMVNLSLTSNSLQAVKDKFNQLALKL